MDGVLNINKPSGMTSHDVVEKARRTLKIRRIGHTGTLDPLATGVLVLCVGKATRIARFLEAGEKEYKAVMRLGVTTDTLDAEGRILEHRDHVPPDREAIIDAAQRFIGPIMQRPPAYSAVKIGGVPSYKLAREGKAEELKPRAVTIHSIYLHSYDNPFVGLTVRCSKGVYIRTLCAEIGDVLGMGAHLAMLERTRSGRFEIDQSISLDRLGEMAAAGTVQEVVTPIDDALADFPSTSINEGEAARVLHGNAIDCPKDMLQNSAGLIRLHGPGGGLVALGRVSAGVLKPDLVFS